MYPELDSPIPRDILALAEPEPDEPEEQPGPAEPEQPVQRQRPQRRSTQLPRWRSSERRFGRSGTQEFRFEASGGQVMVRSFYGANATDRRRLAERWAGQNGWKIIDD